MTTPAPHGALVDTAQVYCGGLWPSSVGGELLQRDRLRVDAGPRQGCRATARGELECVRDLELRAEREGEPGGEAIARSVAVDDRPRDRRRRERATRLRPTAESARGGD